MTARSLRVLLAFPAALLLGVPVHPPAALAAEPGRHVLQGPEVSVYNLAGEVRIVEGSGSSVVVEITAAGRDKDRLTAEIRPDAKGRPSLCVIYPERRIVYREGYGPPEGVSRSSMDYLGHRVTITSRGTGLEAHADIRILVPRRKTVHVHNAVGKAFLTDVDGNLSFEGASSDVEASRISGSLSIDVGSGNVSVSRTEANMAVDTGSGDVRLTDVSGNVSLDAGSGDLELRNVGAEKISLDAGSGSITASNVKASAISADCGSGDVDLDGTAAEHVALDAGSGSVHLRLTQNVDRLAISAGSGSVKLEAPRGLSARFRIECPKRNLHIDFPAEIEHGDEDSTEGTIGSGEGSISIEAGSGRVNLVRM